MSVSPCAGPADPVRVRGGGRRRILAGAMVLAASASACAGGRAGQPEERAAGREAGGAVSVNLGSRHQAIDGFGFSQRVWADPHLSDADRSTVPPDVQSEVLATLFGYLRLSRLRAILDPPEEERDSWNYAGKRADDHIALVKQARGHGLRTFLAAPVGLAPWMRDDPQRYVDWALGMLLRWREMGAELPFFSPVNEPAHPRAGDLPASWLVEVVARLGPRMHAAGLDTRLVIPDDLNPDAAYHRAVAVLGDERARPFVGALAYHLYSRGGDLEGQLERMASLARRHQLPVWMTEYSDDRYGSWPGSLEWSKAMHQVMVRGQASAVDYLWGFFGSQERAHTLVSLDMRDGVYRSRSAGPVYHLMGQFSRFVGPGCVRVEASSRVEAVLVTAFDCPGAELVIVTINGSEAAPPLTISVGPGRVAGPVRAVRTSERENGVTLGPVASEPQGFVTTVPARSVTTFVATLAR